MKVVAIMKVSRDPKRHNKVHIGARAGVTMRKVTSGDGIHPLCGGGRGAKQVLSWAQDFQGLKAVNCVGCLMAAQRMTAMARNRKRPQKGEHECIRCGCTDFRACVTEEGPCSWAKRDYKTGEFVCSACVKHRKKKEKKNGQ